MYIDDIFRFKKILLIKEILKKNCLKANKLYY